MKREAKRVPHGPGIVAEAMGGGRESPRKLGGPPCNERKRSCQFVAENGDIRVDSSSRAS